MDYLSFESFEEAVAWMHLLHEYDNVENTRMAHRSSPTEMAAYEAQKSKSKRAAFDRDVIVNGLLVTVGCNYGPLPKIDNAEATRLYRSAWCPDLTSLEQLYTRIRILAENGASHAIVYVDSLSEYEDVKAEMLNQGFNVEDYNGGGNNTLQINWGS